MTRTLTLYNKFINQPEPFEPLRPPSVTIYLCGPTVYNSSHLGHARSAITFDLLHRYLLKRGYQVEFVRNITDVGHLMADQQEDKIIRQARHHGIHPMAVAQRYTESYHQNLRLLNILPPSIEPRATGHIIEQIACVQNLLQKGSAYESNGSVYFDLTKYAKVHHYGILSGRKLDQQKVGTRPLEGSQEKKAPYDFALWKKAPKGHLMQWPSPWGQGFPGWHIECTAMSHHYLGTQFDIHGGGQDLIFPHHECEIAQSIALHGKAPARYWMHHNLVFLGKEKMSKSTGHHISLAQAFSGDHRYLSQPYHPMVIRFFILQSHYRSPVDVTDKKLQQAQQVYIKLINGLRICRKLAQRKPPEGHKGTNTAVSEQIRHASEGCEDALCDDLSTPALIANLHKLRKIANEIYHRKIAIETLPVEDLHLLCTTYTTFVEEVLGLTAPDSRVFPSLLDGLVTAYIKAKEEKNYPLVDAIRTLVEKEKFTIQESKGATDWFFHV